MKRAIIFGTAALTLLSGCASGAGAEVSLAQAVTSESAKQAACLSWLGDAKKASKELFGVDGPFEWKAAEGTSRTSFQCSLGLPDGSDYIAAFTALSDPWSTSVVGGHGLGVDFMHSEPLRDDAKAQEWLKRAADRLNP